jgi:hypothetical protein
VEMDSSVSHSLFLHFLLNFVLFLFYFVFTGFSMLDHISTLI